MVIAMLLLETCDPVTYKNMLLPLETIFWISCLDIHSFSNLNKILTKFKNNTYTVTNYVLGFYALGKIFVYIQVRK